MARRVLTSFVLAIAIVTSWVTTARGPAPGPTVIQCLDAPAPCGPPWPGFPQFGSIVYRHVTVNGLTLRQLGATAEPGSNGGTARIRTTVLNTNGAGFKLIWAHA